MTEDIAKQIVSEILGFKETKDIINACWRLTPRIVEKLLNSQPITHTDSIMNGQ